MATVISADISRMGRLRPGDTVKFKEVTADEAEKARFEHEKMVLSAISGFVNADQWLDEKALYTENLISGFLLRVCCSCVNFGCKNKHHRHPDDASELPFL